MNAHRLDTGIAVTAMACRFPGASDLSAYWHNLSSGISAIERFELEALRRQGVAEEMLRNPSFVPASAPIPDPHAFDAAHFGLAAATAQILDLQNRAFLECAWTALEASGALAARNPAVAVFGGCSDPSHELTSDWDDGQAGVLAANLGSSPDFFASRISYLLDLQGPAVTTLAACATSLVAVHLAVQSLLTHECDIAVAGGAAVRHPLRRGHLYEPGGIYSSDGLCKPYDHTGDGIVSGDGAGAVVLRRLRDAIEDGDPIHAVIRGTAVANDGARKGSFTAPSVEGQVEAAQTALEVADVDPATIGYVEGHGTATPMGDPIEVEALRRVWSRGSKRDTPCFLGSVKSGIGHLDAAAGVASLIKACLAIEHARIPGTLNYSTFNPHCGPVGSPFTVSAETSDWDEPLRRASVHSLGLGGANAHVVLEQAPATERLFSGAPAILPVALTLSARRPEAMGDYGAALAEEIATRDHDLSAVAGTLQRGRTAESYRRIVVGCDRERLVHALRSLPQPTRPAAESPRLIIAFAGDGKRLQGALGELAEHLPPVADTLENAARHFRSRWNLDLSAIIDGADDSPDGIIPAIVAQGVALHTALAHFGASGDLVLGQSLGEITAAVAAGLLDLHEALDLAMAREKVFRAAAPSGALAIGMDPDTLAERLPEHLELSLVNSPVRSVVSGEVDALSSFAADLESNDVPVHRLRLISAVHCSILDPVLDIYQSAARLLRPRKPARAFLSSVGPSPVDEEIAKNPDHWVRQLRETVRFDACLQAAASDPTFDQKDILVVDAGPTGGLVAAIQETVGKDVRGVVSVAPHRDEMSELEAFALALGKLWEHGVPIDWDAWPRHRAQRVSLPVPPLARTLHRAAANPRPSKTEPLRSDAVNLWTRSWKRAPSVAWKRTKGRRIAILGRAAPFCPTLADTLTRSGHDAEVIPRGRADLDHFDLVVDARALEKPDGPRSIAAFLELAGLIAQQPANAQPITETPEAPTRLFVLTRGAFDIFRTESLSPASAAVAAAALVVAQEHRNLDLTCLDLADEAVDLEMLVRVLTSEVANTSAAAKSIWLGLRGRTLWQPLPERVDFPQSREHALAAGVCVLFGGLGRFGREVGRQLAQHGCPELYLVGRGGAVSEFSADAVSDMRKAGARVNVVQADVTRREDVFRTLDDARRASEGPLTIFHLAGKPHAPSAFSSLEDLVRDPLVAAEEQWDAKVRGAETLLEWTRRHPEDRCVVFSSNASVLGGPGLAVYAAANAALDTFAIAARGREDLIWCSIGWDGWRLAEDETGPPSSALESFALRGEEPWSALQEAVAAELGHISVAKGSLTDRHKRWVEERGPTDLHSEDAAPLDPEGSVVGPDEEGLTATVRRIWSEVLGAAPENDDADLFEVGGDSLSAMRIRTRIERTLGIRLTLQEVRQNRTIARLVALARQRDDEEEPVVQNTIQGRI